MHRFRFGDVVRGVPPVVWASTLLFALVLSAYSVLLPMWHVPDEHGHVDIALAVSERWSYPVINEHTVDPAIRGSLAITRCCAPDVHLEADEALPRGDRPALADIDKVVPAGLNQIAQHPPLYYYLMAGPLWVVRHIGDGPALDRLVGTLRLLNVALLSPLPLLAHAAFRRLFGGGAGAIAAALTPLLVPQLSHIGAAVNNDNLLVLLSGALTVAIAFVVTGDLSASTAAKAGALLGAAMLTKGFAVILVPWLVVAYGVAWRRTGRGARGVVRPMLIAGVAALLAGGWWWIRNLVVFGTIQPVIYRAPNSIPFDGDPWWFTQRYLAWMVWRFWGWFGAFAIESRLSFVVVFLATGLVLAGVGTAWRCDRSRRWPALDVATLALPLAGLLVLQWARAFSAYSKAGFTPAIQGRYLFAGALALLVAATAGWCTLLRGRVRWLPVVIIIGAVIVHADATAAILGGFWGPAGASFLTRLRAMVAWSPWPAELVATGGVALATTTVATALLAIRAGMRRSDSVSA